MPKKKDKGIAKHDPEIVNNVVEFLRIRYMAKPIRRII